MYKSFSGIQFHLYNYDHENPENNAPTPLKKPGPKKKGQKWHHRQNRRSPTPPEFLRTPQMESLTYAEAQRLVEVDLDGRTHRINIYEPLEIISQDELENVENSEKEERPDKSPTKASKVTVADPKKKDSSSTTSAAKLPEASFKILDDYVKPADAPVRPASYYRFIEKNPEELDDEVEYDMDEEVSSYMCLYPILKVMKIQQVAAPILP